MNYLSMILALIALGVSLSQILLDPNVTESKDGFCHQSVKVTTGEICDQKPADTVTDGTLTADICVIPYTAGKCP